MSTVSFTCVPVEEQFVGKDIRNLGEGSDHSVFGVVHPDGSMDLHLAHKKLILQQNDMIIYANMCDLDGFVGEKDYENYYCWRRQVR